MKVVGIVAEYNPFHNGHLYQIQKAKELTGADYVVVAMSGNYVQRGTPAILNKFERTKAAISNGADLVFEIPTIWSCASAEYFAAAAIALFERLGFVDYISFGCETPNPGMFETIALILNEEPQEFRAFLSNAVKMGLPFPAAREYAFIHYLKNTDHSAFPLLSEDKIMQIKQILSSPNNILGIEYIRELLRRHSKIRAVPIQRIESGYHEQNLTGTISSATSVRKKVFQLCDLESDPLSSLTYFKNNPEYVLESRILYDMDLTASLPQETMYSLTQNASCLMHDDFFSEILYAKLLLEPADSLAFYADCSLFLANRIKKLLPYYHSFSQFCDLIKSRDMTYTRISRVLMHICLGMQSTDYKLGRNLDYIPYLRILGLKREASHLLRNRDPNDVPIIQKITQADKLDASARWMLDLDAKVSDLYYGLSSFQSDSLIKTEAKQEIIVR
ncbi:MAG: nucleotidyltransferase family protein [Lachnospiraceae bacterium]